LADQFGHRLDAGLGVRHQHQGAISGHGHCREIFSRVKVNALVHLGGHQHGVGAPSTMV
jgi:hypothetical protein